MEHDSLKTLFERIGQELGIQANLITCKDFVKQQCYGWAQRIKDVNWIYINTERITEDFIKYGVLQFEGLSWKPASSIELALFFVVVHEYTHLIGTPESRTGFTDEDYFTMMAPLGSRDDIVRASNYEPQTEEERARHYELNEQKHTDLFFNLLRVNVYRCWRLLAELENEATGEPGRKLSRH